jgi:hypothetical protein
VYFSEVYLTHTRLREVVLPGNAANFGNIVYIKYISDINIRPTKHLDVINRPLSQIFRENFIRILQKEKSLNFGNICDVIASFSESVI